jgi:hypothetical protein
LKTTSFCERDTLSNENIIQQKSTKSSFLLLAPLDFTQIELTVDSSVVERLICLEGKGSPLSGALINQI